MSKKVALPIAAGSRRHPQREKAAQAADYHSITHGEQLSLPCAWPRPPSLAALRQFTLKGGGFCRRQKTEGLLNAAFAAEAALQSPTAYRRSPLCTRGPWVRVKYGANLAKNVHKRQTRQTATGTRGGTSRRGVTAFNARRFPTPSVVPHRAAAARRLG